MFARSVFKTARPAQTGIRRYATEGPSSGSSNGLLIGIGAAALAGGGYYYYYSSNSSTLATSKSPPEIRSDMKPSGQKTFQGGDQGFIDLKLEKVDIVNTNTKKFRFALAEPDDVSGLKVASAILTKYKGPEDQKPTIRPYTPVSDEGAVGHIDLLVKKYDGGPMSTHMHDMQPGQRLQFKGPLPKYPLSPNQHNHIALLAGGTGITPMYQLCRAIFSNPEDKTKVTLVFGNVKEEDILLKREFEDLENQYPQRFRAFYVLDQPPEKWQGGKGFISKELLKTVLPEPKTENIKVFVCGPPGLYKAISGAKVSPKDQGELSGVLKELGYSKDQVYKF